MFLFFLAVLVGIDPSLRSESFGFVGPFTLVIYVASLILRIVVDAVRKVDDKQARDAGTKADSRVSDGLKERKLGAKQ